MIENIDHIAIAVWNIDKALPFYTEQLKLKVIEDELLPSAGVRLAYLDGGSTMIQLVQPIGDTPIRKFLEEKGEGLHHLCFGVTNIPDVLSDLDGEQMTKVVMGGRKKRASFLSHQPNGLRIELTEMEPFGGE
ncbi:VOC family protein [Paenibacillus sp. CF384]|uniref:VOC family protein n=1 Tax=Paenibacillus sp. CF384 TaxID=1884382 RepID=UPI00089B14C2|nr:VOC family protein [Paenibacillus sp. CF384]SDW48167.1 methylmalonyl-CoA epimerase [Paenibacillus sp. CF384]